MSILQIQEWLCLNCQTNRAISGQLGDMGKMPPVSSGSKASPVPAPADPSSQKTGSHMKGKKKETEVKTEAKKLIPEKETVSIEKTPPTVTTDEKLEETKLEKSKVSALQEKKSSSEEEKPRSEEKMGKEPSAEEKLASAEENPPLEGKKPTPEDKKLPPEVKPLALEGEEKHEILQAQVQIPEEKPTGSVVTKALQEEGQPEARTGDQPGHTPQPLPKQGEKESQAKQPQVEGSAKSDQVDPNKEKTVSCISCSRSLIYAVPCVYLEPQLIMGRTDAKTFKS